MYAEVNPMKLQRRAFKILYPHRFLDGRSVPRADYYEAENPVIIEHLIRSQGALEVELRDRPVEPPKVLANQPTVPEEPKVDGDVAGEEEPKWDFRTISDLRAFLDASGVELPSSGARKAIHVQVCRAAWAEGKRPHPFYGFPGGPQPSAGMSGPNYLDLQVCEDAVVTGEAVGVRPPLELVEHIARLKAPPAPAEEPELDPAAEEEAQAEPSAPEGSEGPEPTEAESDSAPAPEAEPEAASAEAAE